ncbi:MAG: hypothetical protein P8Q48_24090 [Paracoccaceae bacterium]|nr:hypothetical protein [Paracoccaceae bacterium]
MRNSKEPVNDDINQAQSENEAKTNEVIVCRVIHSMASTGTTAIARCVAALPNVMLMNEVSPNGLVQSRFSPIDPVEQALSRYDDFKLTQDDLERIFAERLLPVMKHCDKNKSALVLRDHSHSDFMNDEAAHKPPRGSIIPAIRNISPKGRIASLVIVRHPLASYITARKSGFLTMAPSLDDYCARYKDFLDHYRPAPRIRFEAFTANAWANLQLIANHLNLTAKRAALRRFTSINLSGNSGRHGGDAAIHPVLMRPFDEGLRNLAQRSPAYATLCDDLQYPQDPLEHARVQLRAALDHDPANAAALEEYKRLKI